MLNGIILHLTKPVHVQRGESETETVETISSQVQIVYVDELFVTGLGGLETPMLAYVNFMESRPAIYVDKNKLQEAGTVDPLVRNGYLYRHEFAHILQKQYIQKIVGNKTPTFSDPIFSFQYYFQVLKLNHDLQQVMPSNNQDAERWTLFPGLEVSADCYAQRVDYDGKPLQYMGSGGCNKEQRYIILSLLSERPPTPLTETEHQKLDNIFPNRE